jgi:hypothetical protein
MDKVAVGQVTHWAFQFPPVRIIPSMSHIHISFIYHSSHTINHTFPLTMIDNGVHWLFNTQSIVTLKISAVCLCIIYNGPTNALVCNKTLIQMSHTKTFKITPTCFDHLMMETCWSDFKCFSV